MRSNNLLLPSAGDRPQYTMGSLWPRERIGFFEGQASAFYNVSAIERDYFEMWYFENLGSYKSAAHGNSNGVLKGHQKMDASLDRINSKADKLRSLAKTGKKKKVTDAHSELWMKGKYTDCNREHN